MKRSIPILLYHHVAPDREITPEGFERQLRYLLDQGYQSLSMEELLKVIRGQWEPERPGFVLAFDDGYTDNRVYAFPVLQKLDVKALIYLVTERVESHAAGFLSWSEVREMANSRQVCVGSHTHTHRHFVRREPYADLETELRRSKELIESQTGAPCDHLAWPWGDFETEWQALAQGVGYRSAATTLSGANAAGTNPYELKRISVRRVDLEWLATRLRWNTRALTAQAFGLFYGWDRRFKVWWNAESPYPHG